MQENPLWDYSLSVYERAGVEPLLLQLQDEFDLDVNLLLAACWLAGVGRLLAERQLTAVLKECETWQHSCVGPLRSVRRYLKATPGAEAFREQVKALELGAEQIQQQRLFALLQDCPACADEEGFASLALWNIRAYIAMSTATDFEDEWRRLDRPLRGLVALLGG